MVRNKRACIKFLAQRGAHSKQSVNAAFVEAVVALIVLTLVVSLAL